MNWRMLAAVVVVMVEDITIMTVRDMVHTVVTVVMGETHLMNTVVEDIRKVGKFNR